YKEVPEEEAYQHYHTLIQRLFNHGLSVLPIFTTNYDQVLESYAEHSRSSINFVDGFSRGHSGAGTLRLDTNLFETSGSASNTMLFFKLHGSTTWFKHKVEKEVIFLPFGSTPSSEYDNLLIYPSKAKTDILEDYPFNEHYKYLKRYLESESVRLCIVIGYSFGDPAINEHFRTAIERGMRLLIIDPNPDAANLRSKISLQSDQHIICSSPFDSRYWQPHITRALEQELKRLST
ncbi:SIR2 family protein, partial [Chloroflexota bacterium]